MYWKDEDDEEEERKEEVLDDFEEASLSPAWVVASSKSEFTHADGDNPPHRKARYRYEETVRHFICTHEHPTEDDPGPVKFEFSDDGFDLLVDPEGEASEEQAADLSEAVESARGTDAPPEDEVGFGCE